MTRPSILAVDVFIFVLGVVMVNLAVHPFDLALGILYVSLGLGLLAWDATKGNA